MDKYIVVMDGGKGIPVFLTDEDGNACLIDTRDDAVLMAENNARARAAGYKVFPWYIEE